MKHRLAIVVCGSVAFLGAPVLFPQGFFYSFSGTWDWPCLAAAAPTACNNSGVVVTRALRAFWPELPALNAPIDLGFWILLPVTRSLQSCMNVCLKMQTGSWKNKRSHHHHSPKRCYPALRETLTASLLSQPGSEAWRIPPFPLRGCKGAFGTSDGSFVSAGIN